ncbi:MAG: patatin-like phospholipase family protein [Acholeplasmataceae bacterium]
MKIGLMLGGGGAFGAYQLGVIKALKEENLLDKISVMAGSSIGAVNILMIMAELSLDEMEEIWNNFNNDSIKAHKVYFKNKKKSWFNTDSFYEEMITNIDIDKIKNSKIKGYATVKEVKSSKIRHQANYFHGEKQYLLLNEADNPFQVTRGSTSIPLIFGIVEIDNHYYVDGGTIDNNPMTPLIEEGCDLILAVPLATKLNYKKYEKEGLTIIDFKHGSYFSRFNSFNLLKVMNFDENFITKLKEEGYHWAKEIIKLLKKRQIIDENQFKIDNKDFKYYNLIILKGE